MIAMRHETWWYGITTIVLGAFSVAAMSGNAVCASGVVAIILAVRPPARDLR